MEVSETYPGVPSEVLKRCYGKQAPITPHSQRLLVAATKEAKAEAKGHGKGNGKGKGKGKGSKPKIPPKRSLKEKKAANPKKKSQKPVGEPKPKTPYAEAKAKFFETFRVHFRPTFQIFQTWEMVLNFVASEGVPLVLFWGAGGKNSFKIHPSTPNPRLACEGLSTKEKEQR